MDAPPAIGSNDRPIAVRFVLPEGISANQAARLQNDLVDAFADSDLNVRVEALSNETEALRVVCGLSRDETPSAAWMSPFTYASAVQVCQGEAVLAAFLSEGLSDSIGTSIEIIGQSDLTALSDLKGKVFCRIGASDEASWILPSLFIASEGVDPFSGLAGVLDYPDDLALLRGVYDGECAAAAFPVGEYTSLRNDLIDLLDEEGTAATSDMLNDKLTILLQASENSLPDNLDTWNGFSDAVIPFSLLVFPRETVIPKEIRLTMQRTIADFFNDRTDGPGRSQSLVGADGVFEVTNMDLRPFVARYNAANWELVFVE